MHVWLCATILEPDPMDEKKKKKTHGARLRGNGRINLRNSAYLVSCCEAALTGALLAPTRAEPVDGVTTVPSLLGICSKPVV